MRLPDSAARALRWTVLAVSLALLAIVAVYAVNALLSVAVFLVLLLVAVLVVWVVGGRFWDWARHGKPLFRGGWRASGSDGGDAGGD